MKTVIGNCLIGISLVISAFITGYYFHQLPTPQIISSEVTKTIWATSPAVTQTIYQDRFITEIRHFESKTQFYSWYLSVKDKMFADSKPSWLCSDYSWWLVERATNDGYLLSYSQIWNDAYNSIFKWNKFAGLDGSHAIVSTPINDFTVYLEPQNGEIFPPIK